MSWSFSESSNFSASSKNHVQVQPSSQDAFGRDAELSGPMKQTSANLSVLEPLESVIVKEQFGFTDAFCSGCGSKNKSYDIFDEHGTRIWYAAEDTPCFGRCCRGSSRNFDIVITNAQCDQVLRTYRPESCFGFCERPVYVETSPGTEIGRIQKGWGLRSVRGITYEAFDSNFPENAAFSIEGPSSFCNCSCCCCDSCSSDPEFEVMFHEPYGSSNSKRKVGSITRKYDGMLREMFSSADTFSCTFPRNFDVRLKAILIGAVFLIDFAHFEPQTTVNTT